MDTGIFQLHQNMILKGKEHGYVLPELTHGWQSKALPPEPKVIAKSKQSMVSNHKYLGYQHESCSTITACQKL